MSTSIEDGWVAQQVGGTGVSRFAVFKAKVAALVSQALARRRLALRHGQFLEPVGWFIWANGTFFATMTMVDTIDLDRGGARVTAAMAGWVLTTLAGLVVFLTAGLERSVCWPWEQRGTNLVRARMTLAHGLIGLSVVQVIGMTIVVGPLSKLPVVICWCVTVPGIIMLAVGHNRRLAYQRYQVQAGANAAAMGELLDARGLAGRQAMLAGSPVYPVPVYPLTGGPWFDQWGNQLTHAPAGRTVFNAEGQPFTL
jgi:hypothetical protein